MDFEPFEHNGQNVASNYQNKLWIFSAILLRQQTSYQNCRWGRYLSTGKQFRMFLLRDFYLINSITSWYHPKVTPMEQNTYICNKWTVILRDISQISNTRIILQKCRKTFLYKKGGKKSYFEFGEGLIKNYGKYRQ